MARRRERGDTRAWTLTLLALGIALAIVAAQRWRLSRPAADTGSASAVPCWVTLGPIEAITGDGSTLRVRLALDACDAGSQGAINARRDDLEAIVRVVVAGQSRAQLEGAAGMQRLRNMLTLRFGEHVRGVGAEAVREVVIDQFVLRRS